MQNKFSSFHSAFTEGTGNTSQAHFAPCGETQRLVSCMLPSPGLLKSTLSSAGWSPALPGELDFKDSQCSSQEKYCKAALKNPFDLIRDYRVDAAF